MGWFCPLRCWPRTRSARSLKGSSPNVNKSCELKHPACQPMRLWVTRTNVSVWVALWTAVTTTCRGYIFSFEDTVPFQASQVIPWLILSAHVGVHGSDWRLYKPILKANLVAETMIVITIALFPIKMLPSNGQVTGSDSREGLWLWSLCKMTDRQVTRSSIKTIVPKGNSWRRWLDERLILNVSADHKHSEQRFPKT